MSITGRASRVAPHLVSWLFYLASVLVVLREVFRGTRWVHWVVDVFSVLVFPVDDGGLGLAALFAILGAALMRRKRAAWWLATLWPALVWLTSLVFGAVFLWRRSHGEAYGRLDEDLTQYLFNTVSGAALLALLLVSRAQFAARMVAGNLRRALLTLAVTLGASLTVGFVMVTLTSHQGRPRSRLFNIIQHLVNGSSAPTPRMVPAWVQLLVGALVAASLLISLLVLRRSQRSQAQLALADELELRRLLEDNPEDSLGYFALRRDKQAVFAADRRSAVAYRVELGVCLAAGDPVGRRENWPQAIGAWLALAHRYGWTPGVVGASENGAAAYPSPARPGPRAMGRPACSSTAGCSPASRCGRCRTSMPASAIPSSWCATATWTSSSTRPAGTASPCAAASSRRCAPPCWTTTSWRWRPPSCRPFTAAPMPGPSAPTSTPMTCTSTCASPPSCS